eukprot:scaffold539_cov187-Ochromonas_danica.AAC.18
MMDGKGRVLRVWGGISRKAYDGDFLKLYKEELNKGLNVGSVVVGMRTASARGSRKNLKKMRSPNYPRSKPLSMHSTRGQEQWWKGHLDPNKPFSSP